MFMLKKLLNARRKTKKSKPEFIRQEYHTHPQRLGRTWRQPMGRTSKLRYKEKPRGKHPSLGYRSPALVRGLDCFGYIPVAVANSKDLGKITDNKTMAAVISSGVGAKKKLEIIRAAKEKGVIITNMPKGNLEKHKKPAENPKAEKQGKQ
jgi:large subunit ribosomal protein L32e